MAYNSYVIHFGKSSICQFVKPILYISNSTSRGKKQSEEKRAQQKNPPGEDF